MAACITEYKTTKSKTQDPGQRKKQLAALANGAAKNGMQKMCHEIQPLLVR
jgi:hypothetical protein